MATIKQQRLAKLIVESAGLNNPPTAGQMLEKVRYGKISQQPSRVLKSKGVQEALKDLGFTVEGADSVVKHILYKGKKEETKLKAAEMVYKRLGSYADTEQGANKTLIINITGETAMRYGITPTQKPSDSSD